MSPRGPAEPSDDHVHRALASPVRRRLLERLRASEQPVDVFGLAEGSGLHVNTVRGHLSVLEEAHLVASEAEQRDRVGRPRLVYRPTRRGTEELTPSEGGYRFLAGVLASYLSASAAAPRAAAEEAGTEWGRHLVEGPAPFQSFEPREAIDRVVEMLDEFGFAPQLEVTDESAPKVLLHRCPFLDVAREHQDVVCSVHLGLMRGALDELGVQVEAGDLRPFVEPDLCVADLQVTT